MVMKKPLLVSESRSSPVLHQDNSVESHTSQATHGIHTEYVPTRLPTASVIDFIPGLKHESPMPLRTAIVSLLQSQESANDSGDGVALACSGVVTA